MSDEAPTEWSVAGEHGCQSYEDRVRMKPRTPDALAGLVTETTVRADA